MLSVRKYWFVFLVLTFAIVLRMLWPEDMEWKADEMLMHSMAAEAVQSGDLPFVGMKSGAGPDNPGFSVWPFVLMYSLSDHPLNMVVFVQLINVLALVMMYFCVNKYEGKDREVLLLSLAIMAFNVLNIIWSRKIWAQNLLPLFTAAIWWCYLHRHKNITLFFMGVLAALAGQLHISGFFYAAGFMLAVLVFKKFTFLQIRMYAGGFILGLIPALPWMNHILHRHEASNIGISHIFKLEYFLHLFTDPLGINVLYSLGANGTKHFNSEFKYIPLLLVIVVLIVLLLAIYKWLKGSGAKNMSWNKDSELLFLFMAFVVFPGLLLTLSASPVRSHYLIAAMPFAGIWLSWLLIQAFRKKAFLFLIPVLLLSGFFMYYIHKNKGCTLDGADYGPTWQVQQLES